MTHHIFQEHTDTAILAPVFLQPEHIPWRFILLYLLFLVHISKGSMGSKEGA